MRRSTTREKDDNGLCAMNRRTADMLIGRTIVRVRPTTEAEAAVFGFRAAVIVLSDGTQLIAIQDDEGNGPGAIYIAARNTDSVLCVERQR